MSARPASRLPLYLGLGGVLMVMVVCIAFVVGLVRAQQREQELPATARTTVGHWLVLVTVEAGGAFEVKLRHSEAATAALPSVALNMAGMGATPLVVRPLSDGAYGASGTLSMQGDWRLIVEDRDSTAEIPLPRGD